VNPKGLVSSPSSGPSSSENVRKINTIISLRSGRKIDNQVGNSKAPFKFPHNFFQNSSPSSPVMDSEDTTYGVPVDSSKDSPLNSSSDQEKLKENDSSDLSSPKDASSPSTVEKVQKPSTPLPPFPHRLKKKDQVNVEKIRETFSQVKINIPLLDAIQQMPPYAKFLKDLCTTKRATSVPKKALLASSASSIISHQIPMTYKDPGCPTISIVIGD